MAGKAKKSTHIKKASSKALEKRRSAKPAAPKKRVEIDETVSNKFFGKLTIRFFISLYC